MVQSFPYIYRFSWPWSPIIGRTIIRQHQNSILEPSVQPSFSQLTPAYSSPSMKPPGTHELSSGAQGYKACGLEILCPIPPDEDGLDYYGSYEDEVGHHGPPAEAWMTVLNKGWSWMIMVLGGLTCPIYANSSWSEASTLGQAGL